MNITLKFIKDSHTGTCYIQMLMVPMQCDNVPGWPTLSISVTKMCQVQLFAGQQHVRLESPASSRHWGAWCPQPCERNPLQLTHILSSNSPPAEDASLQKTHLSPCIPRRPLQVLEPLQPLRRAAWAPPWKVSAGAPSVLNLLMFSTYCMYCIANALHCIALHWFEL